MEGVAKEERRRKGESEGGGRGVREGREREDIPFLLYIYSNSCIQRSLILLTVTHDPTHPHL